MNYATTPESNTYCPTLSRHDACPIEAIRFSLRFPDGEKAVRFPFHLRIPTWCADAEIRVNGERWDGATEAGSISVIYRTWRPGDRVELALPWRGRSEERGVGKVGLRMGRSRCVWSH